MNFMDLPKFLKWHISSYLYGHDLIRYLSVSKNIWKYNFVDEFWKYIVI